MNICSQIQYHKKRTRGVFGIPVVIIEHQAAFIKYPVNLGRDFKGLCRGMDYPARG